MDPSAISGTESTEDTLWKTTNQVKTYVRIVAEKTGLSQAILATRIADELSNDFPPIYSINLKNYSWEDWECRNYDPRDEENINVSLRFLSDQVNKDQLKICKELLVPFYNEIDEGRIDAASSFYKLGQLFTQTPVTKFIQTCSIKGIFSHKTLQTLVDYM